MRYFFFFFTTSNKLADDIMRLAIHAGWSAKISTKNDIYFLIF